MRRIAILLLALCLPAVADDLTRITIKVVDDRGKPVERASVRVAFKQGRHKIKLTKIKRSWELKTSQEGVARIPGIPKGDILVQVMSPYYQTYGETLTIEEDERSIEVVLKAPQKQYSSHEGKQ